MPKARKTADKPLVTSTRGKPDARLLDLIAGLAETAASLMLGTYTPENWRDSTGVARLREAALLLHEAQREVPHAIEEALWKADDAR